MMKKKKKTTWPERTETRALALEPGLLFGNKSAKAIAIALKLAAETSTTRKGTPRQTAVSAVSFLLNRSGKNLEERRRTKLARVKVELGKLFDRDGVRP